MSRTNDHKEVIMEQLAPLCPSLFYQFSLDGKILETDNFYYQFFYNQDRQPVPEQEKSLRHIMLTFETRIYTRSEF